MADYDTGTADDILSSFSSESFQSTPDYTPVFLFTPAFAHWADTQGTFLEQCLNRLYQKTLDHSSQDPIHAIGAIIDRLPHHTREGNTAGDTTEFEGVSILLARGDSIQAKAATARQIRSAETEESTLLFSFRENVNGHAIRQHTHDIGLRLANTIFVNGRENTLFGGRWAYDSSSRKLKLEKSTDLSACSVTVAQNNIRSTLQLPLYPVGERRKVISSMGNILSQVAKHADVRSDEPMPASSELEKELPRYIAENDIADRRVSVWALIESTESSSYTKSSHSQNSIAEAIRKGAKLHHVMSGGGGWGKKQGLLSLDPETSFGKSGKESIKPLHQVFSDNEQDSTYSSPVPELPMFMQDLSTLSQTAEPGDYVQFFASVGEHELRSSNSSSSSSAEDSISCFFGVMSDADAFSGQSSNRKNLTVVPNYFGALSEKAITYLQPLAASQSDVSETRTKVDVPGSRVVLILDPVYAPFFGSLGCTSAIVFTCFGAAYGTAKAGVGVCSMGVLRPDLIVKNIVPVVMAGIIGIYGLVVSVLIANNLGQKVPLYTALVQLGAGLAVGLAGLAAGFAIGIVGDAGVRGTAQQPRLYVGMILILIFAEVLGLYGLIVALLMNSRATLEANC
ncbi:V-type proton ATPase 16 kDa proteolipid subunit [Aspergillus mulundensis]|uniref:V-type proton ATPase subunit C n=1 Tax=Aspergillus mulundensis TaxID=1810919 RepID=A0A3D8SLX3_9EURO|nr:Uncharacterized protein DSM5745_03450 [Aspergillus mulundensis]RDW86808.1 Uncharacterized protein DSM5745_03450 [Aspergillus mulundensis]